MRWRHPCWGQPESHSIRAHQTLFAPPPACVLYPFSAWGLALVVGGALLSLTPVSVPVSLQASLCEALSLSFYFLHLFGICFSLPGKADGALLGLLRGQGGGCRSHSREQPQSGRAGSPLGAGGGHGGMGGERGWPLPRAGVQKGEQERKSLWEEVSTSPAGMISHAWDCQDFSGKKICHPRTPLDPR